MKRFVIDFEIENADFDNRKFGILHIINEIGFNLSLYNHFEGAIKDRNGNFIGQYGIVED